MSDINQIIQALKLFNEKADKLARLSFIQEMIKPDAGVTLSWQVEKGGGYTESHERRGPDEESIDAFVLTFRFFIQDNEQSSLRMTAEHYLAATTEDDLKQAFADTRKQINDFLDAPNGMHIRYNGEVLTRRKIMYTFIYGGIAHADSAKKKLYDEWMGIPPLRPLIENEFTYTLAVVLDAVAYIRNLNERALEQIQSSGNV